MISTTWMNNITMTTDHITPYSSGIIVTTFISMLIPWLLDMIPSHRYDTAVQLAQVSHIFGSGCTVVIAICVLLPTMLTSRILDMVWMNILIVLGVCIGLMLTGIRKLHQFALVSHDDNWAVHQSKLLYIITYTVDCLCTFIVFSDYTIFRRCGWFGSMAHICRAIYIPRVRDKYIACMFICNITWILICIYVTISPFVLYIWGSIVSGFYIGSTHDIVHHVHTSIVMYAICIYICGVITMSSVYIVSPHKL